MMSVSRLRDYRGPALFSYGFRPFFFFGSVYAGAIILMWLPVFYGRLQLSTAFAPRDWHVHEMLFGYIAAVVAGFLLTAVPNWTGRLPLQGRPLILLFSTWVAGRIAVSISAWIGWAPAAAIDSVFLILLAASAAREIIAGKKWGNLMIVAIISLLAAGNLAFHLEAHFEGLAEYTTRGGIAVVISLIALIGGRIIPSFTRNWLAKRTPGQMPAPFGRFDVATIALSVLVLLFWVVRPLDRTTGGLLLVCGGMHLIRLVRWTGYRTFADRLVLILHVAYAFVPAGFILTALSAFDLVAPSAGIHAWTGGAIGTMTLAVMSRATLGHTGQRLQASPATQLIYAAVIIAALARVCAVLETDHTGPLLVAAGIAWAAAFLGFAAIYSVAFWSPRRL
ncbi:NnrS family protein [Bradyrhizobium sp. AUGA SZCCT0176]|nr:NnrS family protein [Bradyrhizobium sp. AUGA SZCCT0176]MBR1295778.1 NnrS family protein [Bradyrhizobium sp. AUGA SZCCT0042]